MFLPTHTPSPPFHGFCHRAITECMPPYRHGSTLHYWIDFHNVIFNQCAYRESQEWRWNK
ncbi:hypothetical protein B0J17DRAFT_644576 [Rhizoctonia solani]|nr:hypothetical protein B0J17DRAFT_644576 [Rhizoctonia solani]